MEAPGHGLVGREAECAFLDRLLGDDGPLVVFVHGIGGVGKSALLDAFGRDARNLGAIVLRLNGSAVEPTSRGFLAALSSATGLELSTVEETSERVGGLGLRVILAIDGYSGLSPIDPWLRQTVVPAFADHVRVLIADRDPPSSAWSLSMGRLFASLPLDNLPRPDAEELLRREGVKAADVNRVNRLARGHPLSLKLASAALAASPTLDRDATTMTAMVEELTELYLAGLDRMTRVALDAASVVRRPTLSLLAAMLPDAAPWDTFERLQALPFVELGTDGLIMHDTVREVVAAFLRASDPDRSRRYRIAAWRQLRHEASRAGSTNVGRYTADLLYLLENPVIRETYFPATGQPYVIDGAQADDWPAILRISELQYPGAPVVDLEAWWTHSRRTFRLARDGNGIVVGFVTISEPHHLPREVLNADPVARRWRDHLRQRPVPDGQRAVGYRMERADPDDPSTDLVHAALVLDMQRTWMDLGSALRRHYGVSRSPRTHESAWAGVAFEALGAPMAVDGATRYPFFLDFGPASVDGWLTRLIASELQVEEDSILDIVERQLVLNGRRVDLTRLEFEVFRLLCERPGKVVQRSTMLAEIWGYDDAGGSNIIEALVMTLRRKLGDRASAIETVRGLGYRFVPPA